MTDVSVILPTFNEAGNLSLLIPELITLLEKCGSFEIIVVDDRSTDGTQEVVQRQSRINSQVRLIERHVERGLASALHRGITEAQGNSVVLMDADTTHRATDVPTLLHVHEVFDIVSASRFISGGSMQGAARYAGSYCFNLLVRLLLRTQIQDNLAGFFVIKRELLMKLPLEYIFRGYGDYFFRLLYLARRRGYTIAEIPTAYSVRPYGNSKSNLIRMAISYTFAIIMVRLTARRFDDCETA